MEDTGFSLQEFAEICGETPEFIAEMVAFGIVEPRGDSLENWRFSTVSLYRSKRAIRLKQDLELNLAGIGLTLDLLEELEHHRARIQELEHLLKILHAG